MLQLLKFVLITNLLTMSVSSHPVIKNKLSEESSPSSTSSSSDADLRYEETKIAEKILQSVLEEIYDKYIEPNLSIKKSSKYSKIFDQIENEEKMMADAPNSETVLVSDKENLKNIIANLNKNNTNLTEPHLNFRSNFTAERENVKKQWLTFLQQSILIKTGRENNNTSVPPSITDPVVWILNRTGSVQSDTNNEPESDGDEFVNKKIRSYYPSCDIPRNTDEEAWKESSTMNLFFNVDYASGVSTGGAEQGQDDTVNIATATLRLYRIPQENGTENVQKGNNAHSLGDEDRQIRVSVYWYSRSLKKHKAVKRRLADSRMVSVHANSSHPRQFVELNVRPAAKTWVRGRNLGLGIVVEDVDGNNLNPGDYFKGAQCDMVGNVSTPIPIPTPFLDNLVNRTLHTPYDTLMPKLDICTVELTPSPAGGQPVRDASKIVCRVASAAEDAPAPPRPAQREAAVHIRHHHTPDFRDKFVSKRVVMKNSQLQQLQNSTAADR